MATPTLTDDMVIDLFDNVNYDNPDNTESTGSSFRRTLDKLFDAKQGKRSITIKKESPNTVNKLSNQNKDSIVSNQTTFNPSLTTVQKMNDSLTEDSLGETEIISLNTDTVDLLKKETMEESKWKESDLAFKEKIVRLWESGFKKLDDRLEDIDNSTKQGQLLGGRRGVLSSLFGGKGKIGLLRSGLGLAGTVAGAFGLTSAFSGIQEKEGQSFFGQKEGEGGFFNSKASEFLKGAGSGALTGASIGQFFGPIGALIGAGIGAVGGLLVTGFAEFKDEILAVTKETWEKFKDKPVETVINVLTAIPRLIGDGVIKVFTSVLPTVTDKLKDIGKSTMKFFKQIPSKIKSSVVKGLTFLGDKILDGANFIKNKTVEIAKAVKDRILAIPNSLKEGILSGINTLVNSLPMIAGFDVKEQISEITNTISSIVRWPLDKAKEGLDSIKGFLGISKTEEDEMEDTLIKPKLTDEPVTNISDTDIVKDIGTTELNKRDSELIKSNVDTIGSDLISDPEVEVIKQKINSVTPKENIITDNLPRSNVITQKEVIIKEPVVKVVSSDQQLMDPEKLKNIILEGIRQQNTIKQSNMVEQPKPVNRVNPVLSTVPARPRLQDVPLVSNDLGVLLINAPGIID